MAADTLAALLPARAEDDRPGLPVRGPRAGRGASTWRACRRARPPGWTARRPGGPSRRMRACSATTCPELVFLLGGAALSGPSWSR